ncbi:M35 family metallo-endopeptidase [Massilia niabensis]|uniref:M35 family metallo-endopeptidase n=1 Tax=Massilia niabensis TaxID=544910 RepID=A0ABW0L765_9BURK
MHRTPIHIAACTLLLATTLSSQAAGDIAVSITPDRAALGKRDEVLVTVTLTNTGSTPERLLKWRTPFVAPEAALFDITRDGQPVRYLGRKVKRAAPVEADYIGLAPGESRSARVELSSTYDMAITGAYAVRYRVPALATGAKAEAGSTRDGGPVRSNTAAIYIEGRMPRGAASPALAAPTGSGLSYAECSNAQQDTIASAMTAGTAMAAGGLAYLTSGKEQAQRYTNWFGALDAARQGAVTKNFTSIKDAFETKPVKVNCGCNEDYFAYVYPAQPYTIYVCKAFWTAALTGTDSMGGTLLHELSHFDIVAGTDDHVYGQSGAADMARTAPERAINNADSHEYFGENSPPLN